MVVVSAEADDVPRMEVALAVCAVTVADGDDALHIQRIAQELDRFGDALADADAVGQRADDLMRIRLFQFVVAHLCEDEIVEIRFLFRVRFALHRTDEPRDPRLQRLLLLPNPALAEHVLRHKFHAVRPKRGAAGIPHHIENFRMVQPELEKQRAQRFAGQARDANGRRNLPKSGEQTAVNLLLHRREPPVIVLRDRHRPAPFCCWRGLAAKRFLYALENAE